MAKTIRISLAELSVVAAKLCAHSPAARDLCNTDEEYAHAGKILLQQLAQSVDQVCRAVAFEAGLDDPFDFAPFWESIEGNLLFELSEKENEKVDPDWW